MWHSLNLGSLQFLATWGYIWQVSQLVAEHELQEELPPIGVDGPSLLLEKEAKGENIRFAPL